MKSILVGTMLAGLAIATVVNAGPTTCADPCNIGGWSQGFVPPAAVIESGTSVVWFSLDANSHANDDYGPVTSVETCFFAPYSEGVDSDPIRFDIVGSTLQAVAAAGTANETATDCLNAVPAGGSFLLNYVCVLHPFLMKGALVVVPEA